MIRRALGLMAFGAGLVVVAACGDDEPTAKYPTADSFCDAKAAEECKAVAAACAVADDKCKSTRADVCKALAGGATGEGRTYRPENAENCIAKTTIVYADRVIDAAKEEAFVEACGRVFTGTKQRNEACANEFDCEGTLVCDLDKKLCSVKVAKGVDETCERAEGRRWVQQPGRHLRQEPLLPGSRGGEVLHAEEQDRRDVQRDGRAVRGRDPLQRDHLHQEEQRG